MTELLRRVLDFKRIRAKRWYVPILPLPAPQILLPAAPLMWVAFQVVALGEELGWSGCITDLLVWGPTTLARPHQA